MEPRIRHLLNAQQKKFMQSKTLKIVLNDFDLEQLELANTPQQIRHIIVNDYLKPSIANLTQGKTTSFTTTIEQK